MSTASNEIQKWSPSIQVNEEILKQWVSERSLDPLLPQGIWDRIVHEANEKGKTCPDPGVTAFRGILAQDYQPLFTGREKPYSAVWILLVGIGLRANIENPVFDRAFFATNVYSFFLDVDGMIDAFDRAEVVSAFH